MGEKKKSNSFTLPKVSIIIPTKNRSSLLRETINSICKQTYSAWEAVVTDDGSTDGTSEQMLALCKEELRIRFIPRRSDQAGASVCRNEGLAKSIGDLVIFLDSDDCLAPSCLENRVKAMQANPSLDFGVFPCQLFHVQPGDTPLLWNAETHENDIDRLLHLHDVPWQTASPIWRRQALDQLGPWDESLLRWQDWEFHLRALVKGLKYKKFKDADCFFRMPTQNRETVGSIWTPEHIHNIEQLLSKVHLMLLHTQMHNKRRRRLLAGLNFWIAKKWISYSNQKEAEKIWSSCLKKNLISNSEYWEGLIYFKAQNLTLIERIVAKYLKVRWPRELLAKRSHTFRNTPLTQNQELVAKSL